MRKYVLTLTSLTFLWVPQFVFGEIISCSLGNYRITGNPVNAADVDWIADDIGIKFIIDTQKNTVTQVNRNGERYTNSIDKTVSNDKFTTYKYYYSGTYTNTKEKYFDTVSHRVYTNGKSSKMVQTRGAFEPYQGTGECDNLKQLQSKASSSTSDWYNGIVGIYEGDLMSANQKVKVISSFALTKNKSVTGTYVFYDQGNLVNGDFSKCKPKKTRQLFCNWKDKYGIGVIELKFNNSLNEFTGLWGDKKVDPSFY